MWQRPTEIRVVKDLICFFAGWFARIIRALISVFGKKIKPSDLICPIDLHVARVSRKLNLLSRKQVDWIAAIELTEQLREFDPADPVKYDFALFGLGIYEKY